MSVDALSASPNLGLVAQEPARPKHNHFAILAAKITSVAMLSIGFLAAAGAAGLFAASLFATGGAAAIGGVAVAGAALGLVGAVVCTIVIGREANSLMFTVTEHNAKDFLIHLGKSLGAGALCGALGLVAIPAISATVVVGGFFLWGFAKFGH
jgi:hypothetical protein